MDSKIDNLYNRIFRLENLIRELTIQIISLRGEVFKLQNIIKEKEEQNA